VIFVQLCSSWQDFNRLKASRGHSAIAELLVYTKRVLTTPSHAWVIDGVKCIVDTCVCLFVCVSLCVWLSAATCLHYCTDPDVTWGSGRGCSIVVHYWADLQSVHGLHCYGNTRNAWQSLAVIRQAHRTPHALRMLAKTPLTSDKIDAPAACATLSAMMQWRRSILSMLPGVL